MKLVFPDLPYAPDALEPHYSARSIEFHYGKHHKAYFDKTKELIQDTRFADMELEEIVRDTARDPKLSQLFNNAAQVWNHNLFWLSMSPKGGGKPEGELRKLIDRNLGGYEEFRKTLKEKAVGRFGSGWVWLVYKDGKLDITSTPNAETPLTDKSATVLLTLDVWEHAYYLDRQNRRPEYVDVFLDHLANWAFAAEMMKAGAADLAHAASKPKKGRAVA
jgi:superoxide dismutase, Fe-Mn family